MRLWFALLGGGLGFLAGLFWFSQGDSPWMMISLPVIGALAGAAGDFLFVLGP